MVSKFLISVAPGDALPIYRQIVEQVKAAIASGVLSDGDQLPSHRDLARDVVVAPLTVKRAYDVLEQEGMVLTRRGTGTFVQAPGTDARENADEELDARIRAVIRHARALDLGERELARRLRELWREAKERGGR